MRKKIQIAAFLMLFALCALCAPMTAWADPETSSSSEGETVTAEEENTLSSDNSLSSLKIAQAALNPEFDPQQLTYTVSVPYDVTRIALTASTSSPEAKKVIAGTGDLEVGENIVTVLVTAENGSIREYRITVTREDQPENGETDPAQTSGESENTEPVSQTETAAEGNDAPSESQPFQDETESFESSEYRPIETAVSAEEEGNGGVFLTGRNILLLALCVLCLILLFVIIAVLLLQRNTEEDDEDEMDDEDEDEPEDDSLTQEEQSEHSEDDSGAVTPEELARFYQALRMDEQLDDDMEIVDFDEEEDSEKEESAGGSVTAEDSEEEDLDEDFEMLEDDSDFDFLDF